MHELRMLNLHNDNYEIQLKVVLLGDPSCGKTCFTTRYTQDDFTRQYYPTPGPDFHLKLLTIQNRGVKLILWDIGGKASESSPALMRTYVSSANIVIFMYDITSSESFHSVATWVNTFHLNRKSSTPTYVALVANKCDMEHQRVVTLERHGKLAQSLQLHGFPVSARTGDNVSVTQIF
uniref:Ras-related protein Rab-3 n=1 Tax=Cacopsylla melanoneura TaxID=428564 RepID=A0A8D9E3W3_9HEMI